MTDETAMASALGALAAIEADLWAEAEVSNDPESEPDVTEDTSRIVAEMARQVGLVPDLAPLAMGVLAEMALEPADFDPADMAIRGYWRVALIGVQVALGCDSDRAEVALCDAIDVIEDQRYGH